KGREGPSSMALARASRITDLSFGPYSASILVRDEKIELLSGRSPSGTLILKPEQHLGSPYQVQFRNDSDSRVNVSIIVDGVKVDGVNVLPHNTYLSRGRWVTGDDGTC